MIAETGTSIFTQI